jgi:AcrR family transcriptional regulator
LDRYEALIDAALLQPLETSDAGLDAIDDFLDALGHWITHDGRRGCMVINLMAEDGGDSGDITKRTRRYRQRVRAALQDGLRRAARLGETHDRAIDDRAEMLFGIVLGLNIAARGGAAKREVAGLLAAAHHAVAGWRIAG